MIENAGKMRYNGNNDLKGGPFMVETFTVHITPYDLDRNTFIYLPDNWQTSGRRYPVIYMFDGHNLFLIPPPPLAPAGG